MSANVLLNLLIEFWKRDKMQSFQRTLSCVFYNEFNEFNNIKIIFIT